jgi:hypothetical protein
MYLVIDDASQEAAVVDPYDAPKISNAVKEKGVKVCLRESFDTLQADTLRDRSHH